MNRRLVLFAVCVIALLSPSLTRATELPERLGDWKATERKTYVGQALYDHIDGGAEVYLEYGFSKVEVGYYGKGESEIQIEVYKMASPQSAAAAYSFFRNPAADPLPAPYEGKVYESYFECLNGDEYIKMVAYDSLGVDERLSLLKDLLPEPAPLQSTDFSRLLPEKRVIGSEVLFNGPIALRNFCPLGNKNLFGVSTRARAFGCLFESNGKQYKWVTLTGTAAQLSQDLERFLAFQGKNDYKITKRDKYIFLEDQLSGKNMALVDKKDRIYFLFDVEDEKMFTEMLKAIQ